MDKAKVLSLAMFLVAFASIAIGVTVATAHMVYAQEGNSTVVKTQEVVSIPIATPVEIASLTGIIAGTVIKQVNTWHETPDNQSFNKDHVAFVIALLGSIAGSLALFGNLPLPSNPPSLLFVGVFSLVAGWGGQSISAKLIKGFGNQPPAPAAKPAG